jgi:hypothetical protein
VERENQELEERERAEKKKNRTSSKITNTLNASPSTPVAKVNGNQKRKPDMFSSPANNAPAKRKKK